MPFESAKPTRKRKSRLGRTIPKKTKVVPSADLSSFPAENNENGNVTSNYSPPPPPPAEVTPRRKSTAGE